MNKKLPNNIAIIGAGTMGGGIAITTILAGIKTVLVDSSSEALDRAHARIDAYLSRQVAKGRMDLAAVATAKSILSVSTDMVASQDTDLVIEAVFEKLEIKQAVLRLIESHVSRECLIATNTSCLRVSDIGRALKHPDRFLGLHYFSPAEINPVVEVVQGDTSRDGIAKEMQAFLDATKKIAIPCRDSNGFAINRFFCPYSNEAVRCLEDGLGSPAQIDVVARAIFGQALGPFATMNIIRPEIMLHSLENLEPLGPFYAPADRLREIVEHGENWIIEPQPPALPSEAEEEIGLRLRGAVYLTISELMDEGVASGKDIDLGASNALRFGNPPVAMMLAETPENRMDAIRRVLSR